MNAQLDLFVNGRVAEFDLDVVDRDRAISVNRSVHADTEDVLGGLERRGDLEWAKKVSFIPQGSLIAQVRDFIDGRMDAFEVIGVDFPTEDVVTLSERGHVLAVTQADKVVLQPAVRPFDFAFGLWGEREDRFDPAFFDDLSPLRFGFVRELMVPVMKLIASADEPEDRIRVHVEAHGQAVFHENVTDSDDVRPGRIAFNQPRVEHEPAVVVNGGDQPPFSSGFGRPEVL